MNVNLEILRFFCGYWIEIFGGGRWEVEDWFKSKFILGIKLGLLEIYNEEIAKFWFISKLKM